MKKLLFIMLPIFFISNSYAKPHYWVGQVTKARTVYEPVAEYQYEVLPLGVLYGDESGYVESFSIPQVISHTAVLEGSWALIRHNTDNGNTVILDSQEAATGFVDSDIFYELFISRLQEQLHTVDPTLLSFGDNRIVEFIIALSGTGSADVLYREKNKNMLLVALEYYSRNTLKVFAPFVKTRDVWAFRVSVASGKVQVMSDTAKYSQGFAFNKVFNIEQPIPNLTLLNQKEARNER